MIFTNFCLADLRPGEASRSAVLCHPSPRSADWKRLYTAALFETDKSKIAGKIAEVQAAIVTRRRLSMTTGTADLQERRVLDTALLSLQALANFLAISPDFIPQVRSATRAAEQTQVEDTKARQTQAA